MQDMFESLLFWPSVAVVQVEPFAEIRQRKSREGSKVLGIIKEKLGMFPEDSTELEHFYMTWFHFNISCLFFL
jgi:hypothetical protein